jgi:hypothetical protein
LAGRTHREGGGSVKMEQRSECECPWHPSCRPPLRAGEDDHILSGAFGGRKCRPAALQNSQWRDCYCFKSPSLKTLSQQTQEANSVALYCYHTQTYS